MILFVADSENITVPCPLASKYTPISKSRAAWCKCFTPVLAQATGTFYKSVNETI